MKILYRYIFGKYIKTFLFMMAIIMAVAMVFDVSEKLMIFLNKGAPWKDIFVNYASFLMFYSNMFSPLIAFIAVIWFTSRLAQNTEIIPMLASGIGFKRLLVPYLFGSLLIALTAGMLNHFWIPKVRVHQVEFEKHYYHNYLGIRDVHKRLGDLDIYIAHYSPLRRQVHDLFVLTWGGDTLRTEFKARQAISDSVTGEWHITDYEIREVGGTNDVIHAGKKLDTTLLFSFEELVTQRNQVSTMTTPELLDYIDLERKRGSKKIPEIELELYNRTATPAGIFILTLIAVAVGHKKNRQGTGVHIATGLLIALMYIFAQRIGSVMGNEAGLNTMFSAWFPNIIFTIIGVYLLRRMIS